VPLVGNVALDILSERMVKSSTSSRAGNEKLIVRWRTKGKTRGLGVGAFYKGIGARQRVDKITEWLGGDARDDEEFCGLFKFEFDEEGRIFSHVIERAEGGEGWDSGVGRVVGLTDWLLGRFGGKEKNGASEEGGLALGCLECGPRRHNWRQTRQVGRQ
jgi:Mitochondrial protein up-regulated during meiosis